VLSWKVPYGYRRLPRTEQRPAHLVVHEPEAAVVRRIFDDYVAGGYSIRAITIALNTDDVPTPTGKPAWGTSTVARILGNEAYVGRLYYNQTEMVPWHGRRGKRQVPRPREEWILIPVPTLVPEDVFAAVRRARAAHVAFSARRAAPDRWLLRRLVRCGVCGLKAQCRSAKTPDGWQLYYHCPNHDVVRAGGEHRRCPERAIRAEALDGFVFDHVRRALLRPGTLAAGEAAVAARTPTPNDELLAAELTRLERKADAATTERRRLIDLYQAGLIELAELKRRTQDLDARHRRLDTDHAALNEQRGELARGNRLRRRIATFAERAAAGIDTLDFAGRQRLLRLIVEDVRVTGTNIEIQLRIPLDEPPDNPPGDGPPGPEPPRPRPLSSQNRLRPLGHQHM
jgi:site-specific DNA recombinase